MDHLPASEKKSYWRICCIHLLHRLKEEFAAMNGGLKEKSRTCSSNISLHQHMPYKKRQLHGVTGTLSVGSQFASGASDGRRRLTKAKESLLRKKQVNEAEISHEKMPAFKSA
jgi:hypothetical protein